MLQLRIPEKVYLCQSFEEVENEFQFTEGDFILTSPALSKKYLKSKYSGLKILTAENVSEHICESDILSSFQEHIPESSKRIIVFGSSALINYGKLLHKNFAKEHKKIPLILVSFLCDAGGEMLSRVTLANSKDGSLSEINTLPADSVCLYPEVPSSDMVYPFIAGTINSLIYASETFIHEMATSHTLLFSREALRLLISSYRKIVFQNAKLDADLCQSFLLAGNYTGIAREHTKESLFEPLFEKLSSDIRDNCHIRLLIFIHLFRKHVFTAPTGQIQEYLSYMSTLLECRRSNVYPELLNLVKCVLPPSGELHLPPHLDEIEKLISTN